MEGHEERWKSSERQYILTDSTFIKGELNQEQLPLSLATGQRVQPRWSRERLQNEASTLDFISTKTDIPVPKCLGLFEENGLLHLRTERAAGVPLDELGSDIAVGHVSECLQSSILPQLRKLQLAASIPVCHFSSQVELHIETSGHTGRGSLQSVAISCSATMISLNTTSL
jgi:hypothetical protein